MKQFAKKPQQGQPGRDDKQSHGSSDQDLTRGNEQNPSHSGQSSREDQNEKGGRGGQSGQDGQGGGHGSKKAPQRDDDNRRSRGQQGDTRKGDPSVNQPPSESPGRHDRRNDGNDGGESERGIRPGHSEDHEPDDGKRPGR